MWAFVKALFSWLAQQGPAIGQLIYNIMNAKIARAEQETRDAKLELQIEKNHAKVDSDKRTDDDVVDSIAKGPTTKQ